MLVLDILVCVIVILIGYNLKNLFSGFDSSEKRFLNLLFTFHLVITIAFNFFIAKNGGDAIHFWSFAQDNSLIDILKVIRRGSASGMIYLLNYIPANLLQLSFFTGNIMYSLLGYIGFIYLFRVSKALFPRQEVLNEFKFLGVSIFPLIWFLPNLHFWSSGIGKDTVLFFCITAFIYAMQSLKKRWLLIVISMFLTLAIRPHITLFLLFSFGIAYILDGRLKVYQKIFIFIIFVVGFASIFNFVIDFVRLESFELSTIEEYASKKSASLNQEDAGSGVDTSSYSLPLKIVTFLYRPFFFDSNGILGLLASVENLLLVLFTFLVVKNGIIRGFRRGSYLIKGFFIFFVLGSIAFSLILGNLGIMLRQKNMFFPLFFLFGAWVFYSGYLQKNKET